MSEPFYYVGKHTCGAIVAVAVDHPCYAHEIERLMGTIATVDEMKADGLTVTRIAGPLPSTETWGECRCFTKPAEAP